MDKFLLPAIAALALMVAGAAFFRWMRHLAQARAARLRSQGHRLIHALQAYSAWIDSQRDSLFTASSLDELTSPEPLALALRIKGEWFPTLQPDMLRLLQAHSRMIEYLWQQNLLRMSQGAGWRPVYEDNQYLQLRGAQEDLIDEIILSCRELIGETEHAWRPTGSDFAFSNNSLGLPGNGPASRI
jgi:hypothetical protein